jgi:hypothetical protein
MEKQAFLGLRPLHPSLSRLNACELLVHDVQIVPLAFRRQCDLLNRDWEFFLLRLVAILQRESQSKMAALFCQNPEFLPP